MDVLNVHILSTICIRSHQTSLVCNASLNVIDSCRRCSLLQWRSCCVSICSLLDRVDRACVLVHGCCLLVMIRTWLLGHNLLLWWCLFGRITCVSHLVLSWEILVLVKWVDCFSIGCLSKDMRFELLLAQMRAVIRILLLMMVLLISILVYIYLSAIICLLLVCPLVDLKQHGLILHFFESISHTILRWVDLHANRLVIRLA